MENKLLIYILDRALEGVHWIYFNEQGEKTYSKMPCALSECPTPQNHAEIIVLFPSEEILLTEVNLPPTRRSQQNIAALYALEEKLADEVQNLHAIVVNTSIGVIRKSLLEEWLERFKVQKLTPTLLLPDVLAVPFAEGSCTELVLENRVLVRTHLYQGFAIAKENLPLILEKLNLQNVDILEVATEEKMLEIFLHEIEAKKQMLVAFNLLQGEYRQKTEWLETRKVWRIPAILGACWVALFFGSHAAQYIYLSTISKKNTEEISALYRAIYPEATSIVSPQQRIQKELEQLKGSEQNQYCLELVAKTGNILKAIPETNIESLNFRGTELSVNVQTKDFQMLENIIRSLEKEKLQVKQNDATRVDEKVVATLAIKSGEA